MQKHATTQSERAGAAIYSQGVLSVYDLVVTRFSNTFVWECPRERILDMYNAHVGNSHLDVGVGTGWYIDHCTFPSLQPSIYLADLNQNSLSVTAQRLRRYAPKPIQANALGTLPFKARAFDSIGLSLLLHCLPGAMPIKAQLFADLKPLLKPGGTVFGATVLGRDIHANRLAQFLLRLYNRQGVFNNLLDAPQDLETALHRHFSRASVEVVGCTALFVAQA